MSGPPGGTRTSDRGVLALRRVLGTRRPELARLTLWSTAQALPGMLSGILVAHAVDRYVAGAPGAGTLMLGLMALLSVAAAVATRWHYPPLVTLIEAVHEEFLASAIRGAVHSAARPGARPNTAPVAAITVHVQSLRGIVAALLRSVQYVVVAVGGAVLALAWLAPVAALTTGGLVVVALVLFALQLPAAARRHRAVTLAEEEVAVQAGAALAAARDLLAADRADRAIAEVGHAVDVEVERSVHLARIEVVQPLLTFVAAQLPLILLLVGARWLVEARVLTLGEVVGIATYLTATLEPAVRGVFGVVGTWGLELVVLLGRLGERFAPAVAAEPPGLPPPASADLTVVGLRFGYTSRSQPVVEDLSMTVPEGDHLAVVGPSGIGKSTLAALLAGLLAPDAGHVSLGGIDIRRLREADLRRVVGYIPQEAYLIAGTVRENLRYLRPGATDVDLLRAVEAVGTGGLLARLGGLDARIGAGGVVLSGGEQQLVALTRMYLSEARIVILDEATSLVDPGGEEQAERAFAARPGTTLIVIAHRLSSARRARRVLVLDGDRHQLGDHHTLLTTSPLYAAITGHWSVRPPDTPQ